MLRVQQLVVGVGAGQSDDQRHLQPAGQTQRERPRAIRVERVHERGTAGLDLPGDVGLGGRREIPHRDLLAALAKPGDDALGRDGVAADGGKGEGREDGDPSHVGSIPRRSTSAPGEYDAALRQTGLNPAPRAAHLFIMVGNG